MVANGYWVIFSIPGGIKPKEMWFKEGLMELCVPQNVKFKYSKNNADCNTMSIIRQNRVLCLLALIYFKRKWP